MQENKEKIFRIRIASLDGKVLQGSTENLQYLTKFFLKNVLKDGFKLTIIPIKNQFHEGNKIKNRNLDMRFQKTMDEFITPQSSPPNIIHQASSNNHQTRIEQFSK